MTVVPGDCRSLLSSGRVLPLAFAVIVSGCAINTQPAQQSTPAPNHTVTVSPTVTTATVTTATPSPSPQAESPAPAPAPPTTVESDVDRRGFKRTRARCDPNDTAALIAHTDRSMLVICQSAPDRYYYRAVRVSDGASIDLPKAVPTQDGFDATNVDGTRYRVTHRQLEITMPNGQVISEPMVAFVKPQ